VFSAFRTIIARDLLLAMRRRSDVLTTLFFFVIVVSLFPLGIGPELNTLRLIAPGVFWVAALLLSVIRLPDFITPLTSIANSLKKLAATRAGGDATQKQTTAEVSPPAADSPAKEV